jgi:hypothetical protein
MLTVERDEDVAEIDAAHREPDQRVDDILDQAVDDAGEGGPDDYSDSQIDDVAAGDKRPKLANPTRLPQQIEAFADRTAAGRYREPSLFIRPDSP